MRKRILLIVLYLSTFVQGWCQGEFYYVENLVSKQSIVRQHNGKAYWPTVAIIGRCVISSPTITTHTIINKCR